MTRESAHDKGRRYLVEARLSVLDVHSGRALLSCRGDSGVLYRVVYEHPAGWACPCPVRGLCSHLVAAQLVVVPTAIRGAT